MMMNDDGNIIYLMTMNYNTATNADGVVKNLCWFYMEGEKNPKQLETHQRTITTIPHVTADASSRNNMGLYQSGRSSSYNPDRLGLISELSVVESWPHTPSILSCLFGTLAFSRPPTLKNAPCRLILCIVQEDRISRETPSSNNKNSK